MLYISKKPNAPIVEDVQTIFDIKNELIELDFVLFVEQGPRLYGKHLFPSEQGVRERLEKGWPAPYQEKERNRRWILAGEKLINSMNAEEKKQWAQNSGVSIDL